MLALNTLSDKESELKRKYSNAYEDIEKAKLEYQTKIDLFDNREYVLSKLENERLGLEESVKLYEEGKKLTKELQEELDKSMKKLAYIVEDGEVVPFLDEESEKEI